MDMPVSNQLLNRCHVLIIYTPNIKTDVFFPVLDQYGSIHDPNLNFSLELRAVLDYNNYGLTEGPKAFYARRIHRKQTLATHRPNAENWYKMLSCIFNPI
jgi:hypothetical protein